MFTLQYNALLLRNYSSHTKSLYNTREFRVVHESRQRRRKALKVNSNNMFKVNTKLKSRKNKYFCQKQFNTRFISNPYQWTVPIWSVRTNSLSIRVQQQARIWSFVKVRIRADGFVSQRRSITTRWRFSKKKSPEYHSRTSLHTKY